MDNNEYQNFTWNGKQCRKVFINSDSTVFDVQMKNSTWHTITRNLSSYWTTFNFDYNGDSIQDICVKNFQDATILFFDGDDIIKIDEVLDFTIIDSTQKLYEEKPRTVHAFLEASIFTYKNYERHYLYTITGCDYAKKDWQTPLYFNIYKHSNGNVAEKVFVKKIKDLDTDDFSVSPKLWKSLLLN